MKKQNKQQQMVETVEKKLTPKKVPLYQQELERITKKYNGLTAEIVVNEAKNKNSPLNQFFDWDDDVAGEKWRLWQARYLITTVRVNVEWSGEVKNIRKYLNVRVSNDNDDEVQRAYLPTSVVLTTKEYRDQMLKKAVNEIEYWKKSYNDFIELEDIYNAIDKTQKKLKSRRY